MPLPPAARHTPTLVGTLAELTRAMAAASDAEEFENLAWEFRRAINQEVAGPRLRAAISTFQGLMPAAFWLACADRQDSMLPSYLDELTAIERGDVAGAKNVVARRAERITETVIDELYRRGVFTRDETSEDEEKAETNLKARTT